LFRLVKEQSSRGWAMGRGAEAEPSKQPTRGGLALRRASSGRLGGGKSSAPQVLPQAHGHLGNLQSRCQLGPTVGKLRHKEGGY
jgi:hypothetical protein